MKHLRLDHRNFYDHISVTKDRQVLTRMLPAEMKRRMKHAIASRMSTRRAINVLKKIEGGRP